MANDGRENKFKIPKINHKLILKHAKKVETATARHAHKFIVKRWENVLEVRRQIIVWIVMMCILIAATGMQLIWFQNSYTTQTGATDGTYVEAVLGSIDTLNPLYANNSAEQAASSLLFSRLLRYDKTGHLSYDLASDIKIDDTKKIYTVSLRRDGFWSDGQRITATDVVYTIGLAKSSAARTRISGWDNISVDRIDDYTVKFTLQNVYAAFEYALNFPIVPEHILGGVAPSAILENNFSQSPVVSGPFKLNFIQNIDNTNNHKIVHMIRNENYYGGKTKLARFQLQTYVSTEEILKALSANEVNAAADLTPSDIKHVDAKRYELLSSSIQSGMYALINTRSSVMSDVNIRNALRYGTDTKIIREKLGTKSKELSLPFTSGQITGDIPVVPTFNQAEAKRTLDNIGWLAGADGKREKAGQDLKISVVTVKGSEFETVLELLASQWRAIGFDVETQVVDPNDVTQNVAQNILQPRNYDVFLYQLDIGADPDVYAYWHSSQTIATGLNFSNYANLISDSALASARIRTELDLRNSKYISFAKQWVSDVPAIGLYQSTAQYVFSKNVNSYSVGNSLISSVDRYEDVLEWSVGTQTVYKTP